MNSNLIKDPLNNETVEYTLLNAYTLNGSKYKFMIIALIGILISGLLIFSLINVYKKSGSMPMKFLSIVVGIVVAIILYITSLYLTHSSTRVIQRRVSDFNSYLKTHVFPGIFPKLYNGPLSDLAVTPENNLDTTKIINNILISYTYVPNTIIKSDGTKITESNEKQLGRVFFTLNMYQHYLSVCNNINAPSCISSVFHPVPIMQNYLNTSPAINFLSGLVSSWSPSDYLNNRYTFIEDNTDAYIAIIKEYQIRKGQKGEGLADASTYTDTVLMDAASDSQSYCSEATYIANNFEYNSVITTFLNMATITALLFAGPFLYLILSAFLKKSSEAKNDVDSVEN
jgi:hypothetical protein